MKWTKNIFFLLSFLFIVSSINAKPFFVKHQLNGKYNQAHIVVGTAQDQRKNEFTQLEGLLFSCFRLTENTVVFFQNFENTNPLVPGGWNGHFLFPKQCYLHYINNRLNHLRDFPLYIHHRRLLI